MRIAGFLVLLTLAASVSANCNPFFEFNIDQSREVTQGITAVYTMTLRNTGSATQTASVASACPGALDCSFPDAPNPIYIVPGQTIVTHLEIDTDRAVQDNYSIPLTIQTGISGNECRLDKTVYLRVASNNTGPTPMPQPGLAASIAPSTDVAVQPGRKVQFTIFVENTLVQTQFVRILSGGEQGNRFSDSTVIVPTEFEMKAGEKRSVQVDLSIPAGTPGGFYPTVFRVRGTSSTAQVYNIDLPVMIFVYSDNLYLTLASVPSSCQTAFHLQEATRVLELVNNGQVTGPFTAEVQATSEIYPHLSISQKTFELKKGERSKLEIMTNVPASVEPRRYLYTVFVKYLGFTALRYEDCIDVRAVSGVETISDGEYEILRGTAIQLPIKIVNNGTLAVNYTVDYNPRPAGGVEASVEPVFFGLSSRQERNLAVTISTTKAAPLGKLRLPLTLRSKNLTREVVLNLKIISDNKTSPLQIEGTRFTVFEGSPTQVSVRVTNTGKLLLPDVQLIMEGLPRQWVHVDSGPRDLPGGATGEYLVTFDIPSGSTQSTSKTIPFAIYAASGLESVRKEALLDLFESIKDLQFSVAEVSETRLGGAVSEVALTINLRNAGNVPVRGVVASLPYSSEYAINTENEVTLMPNQAQSVVVRISPTSETREQDVFLRFASADGTQETSTVRLPAMSRDGADSTLYWKIIAIVLLLIAIFAAMNKSSE